MLKEACLIEMHTKTIIIRSVCLQSYATLLVTSLYAEMLLYAEICSFYPLYCSDYAQDLETAL
jgi:hypothetical protein